MFLKSSFEYLDAQSIKSEENRFLLMVPSGISSKSDLMSGLASEGSFPEYFGKNWDALLDSLCDLSWIREREVLIVHSDLPLRGDIKECRIYLEVLQEVIDEWGKETKFDAIELPAGWVYVDHKVRIVFAPKDAGLIADVLSL